MQPLIALTALAAAIGLGLCLPAGLSRWRLADTPRGDAEAFLLIGAGFVSGLIIGLIAIRLFAEPAANSIRIAEMAWLYLPAFVANQAGGITAKFRWPLSKPVSIRWLGTNKTWAVYYAGPLFAIITLAIEIAAAKVVSFPMLVDYSDKTVWLMAISMGFGAAIGDQIESFAKRRAGLPPGAVCWPFDQTDWFAGALVLSLPFTGWVGWERVAVFVLAILLLAPLINGIGYLLGIRKQWL